MKLLISLLFAFFVSTTYTQEVTKDVTPDTYFIVAKNVSKETIHHGEAVRLVSSDDAVPEVVGLGEKRGSIFTMNGIIGQVDGAIPSDQYGYIKFPITEKDGWYPSDYNTALTLANIYEAECLSDSVLVLEIQVGMYTRDLYFQDSTEARRVLKIPRTFSLTSFLPRWEHRTTPTLSGYKQWLKERK